jgi:GNAT superfamily N-acetyltransferase
MTAPAAPTIVELRPDETHPLRLSVLRHDTPTKRVHFDHDEVPGVVHLGLKVGDDLVAVSTWIPRAFDDDPRPAVQLRGMATDRNRQGAGYGGMLVEAGCTRAAAGGAALVWARARDAALAFYRRHAFVVIGDGFVDEATQLPHHLIARELPAHTMS